MAKAKGKKKVWKIVGIVLGIVLALGAIVTIFKADDEKKLNAFDYEIAAVDAEGKVYESDTAIVTKDVVSVNKLKVEYTEEAEVEFRVHLYDEDGKYLSSTEWLQEDYEYEAVEGSMAVNAHIEVRPLDDNDGRVGFFEKGGYVNDIKVTYNPELVKIKAEKDSTAGEESAA